MSGGNWACFRNWASAWTSAPVPLPAPTTLSPIVSPRTGRAVSLSAGEPYRDKLLTLPGFLMGQAAARSGGLEEEVLAGLDLTGHFLDRHAFASRDTAMPAARTRFIERYRKLATLSGSR